MISSMSYTSHTLDKNNSHKRATISNVYASTPIKTSVKRIHSISLSRIDTASSSSGGRIEKNLLFLLQDQAKKPKRYTKEKKRTDKSSRIQDSDSEWETKQKLINESLNDQAKKPKRYKKDKKRTDKSSRIKDSDSEWETKQKLINESLNEKRKKILIKEKEAVKRKRIVTQPEDTEWETESEKSINELATGLQGSILKDDECTSIKLFKDPFTPEKTRDVPSAYEEILHESPIALFSKRSRLISKKNDVILRDELLPVDLLSSEVRNPEEISVDETIFVYKGNAKNKYVRKPKKNPKEKPKNFSIEIPTTTNSLLCNQSVETYPKKTFRHLPSPSAQTPIKLMDFMQKLPDPWEIKSTPIPPGMVCVTGYWDKVLRKWVTYRDSSSEEELENGKRKTKTSKRNTRKQKKKMITSQYTQKQRCDVYDTSDETDIEY